MLQIWIVGSG